MSLSLTPRFPDAVSPAGWGAEVDYDSKEWTPWDPDKFVVHWGGTPVSTSAADGDTSGEEAQLRSWENYHKNSLGWLGIAYNWAIGNSGTLYRLRGDNRAGATSGDYEPDGIPENHEAVAVVFIVGTGQTATTKALDTFRGMYAAVPELDDVIGHKDVFAKSGSGKNTSCPGGQLHAWVTEEGYKQGALMGYAIPVDDTSPEPEIRFMQHLLGVTDDGDWGPGTAAAKVAAVGGLEYGVTPAEAEALWRLIPPKVHGNNQHDPIFTRHETFLTHVGNSATAHGHPHDTGDGWDEARVAALEAHTHDEGATGPPLL